MRISSFPSSPLIATLSLLLWASVGTATVGPSTQSTISRIEVEEGLLTLETREAPVSDVIRAIGERAGFETIVAGQVTISVSVAYSLKPVRVALNELLDNINRIIVYAPSAEQTEEPEILRIVLLASSDSADGAQPASDSTHKFVDLQQADDKSRSLAVLRLANATPTDDLIDALTDVLSDDESPLVRTRAAMALGALEDDRAVPALEQALYDPNRTVGVQAVNSLAQIGSERATMALGDVLLNSTDSNQRVVAAWGLGKQDTKLAQQFLDAVSNDPDEQVRAASNKRPDAVESRTSGLQNAGPAGETE